MTTPQVLTAFILLAALALMLSDRVRPDLVALLGVTALGLAGVLTPEETFSGFSRSAVITILAIFVLAAGLERAGVAEAIGRFLLRVGGGSEARLATTVAAAGAFLSLFMNNIAAASVLLPAVTGLARKARIPTPRLLMPLAYGTILGGMATLLTTTNIVVSSLLQQQGLAGFRLLDFAPVGLPVAAAGVLYLGLLGRRMLPTASISEQWQRDAGGMDLAEVYRLNERLFRARIPPGSYLIGKPLSLSHFRDRYALNVVGVERDGTLNLSPPPDFVLQQGDVVLLEGRLEDFLRRDTEPYLEILPPRDWHARDLESPRVGLVEAILTPRSRLIGQTVRQAHFREKYGLNVIAIWRRGVPIRTGLAEVRLDFGDALLLQGPRDRLEVLRADPDLILLENDRPETVPDPRRRALAAGVLVVTLAAAALGPFPLAEVMLGGALAMVVLGILSMDHAYHAIDWKTVFLVAGVLPMGVAVSKTGLATRLAEAALPLAEPAGPLALLAMMFGVAALLTQAMNGAAVASVVTPIAVHAAQQTGLNPQALGMAVALATSMAFLTPLGHPVNLLVMGPGGYRFRDYLRVGLPLSVLVFVLVLVLLPVVWPLGPFR